MDTKDLIGIKKERIREELEKLVPPGFTLQPHPKNRTSIYNELDKFLGIDETLAREVGYLVATNKEYDIAIQHLRYFGVKLRDYKEVKDTGPFHKDAELNRNLQESCDYLIRFYDLAEITIKRINDEEDVRLKLLQNQQEKEKKALEQSEEKKQKAKSFVSSATQFRPGGKVKIKVTKPTGIIPKRAVPQQVLDTISKKTTEQEEDQNITGSKKLVSDLGRVTLQIEQTNNNLNRVVEIIAEDIANVKEQNRKEVDEYRKRTQDRGKKLGARQLGSSKVDVAGVVKKYVGSFFSGTGGAIRALASFNLIQKLLEGDFVGVIGPLLAIGTTYLPQIGAFVAGLIGKKILKGMFGGGRRQTARTATRVTQSGGVKVPKLGKFGRLGLLAGGLSLGGALLAGRGGDEDGTEQEQRLEQLTREQKGLVEPEDIKPTAIPQSELKRFQSLNEKFDKTLDFLLKKQQEQEAQRQRRSGPGPSSSRPVSGLNLISGDMPSEMKSLMDLIASEESGGDYEAMYPGKTLPGATNMTIAEVAQRATGPVGRYQQKPQFLIERAMDVGLDPYKDKFNEVNQDKITRGHIVNVLGGDESKVVEQLQRDPSSVKRRLEGSQYTGLQKIGEDFETKFKSRVNQYETRPAPPSTPTLPKPDAERSLKPGDKQKISFMSLPGMNSPDQKVALSSSDEPNKTISVSTGGGICKDFSDILQLSCQRIA